MLASLLKYRLELGGYTVDLARDGRAVKSYLNKRLPDLFISDILMPYYSGIELIGYLRKELNSDVPVILISKANTHDRIRDPRELGADDFISKPLNPADLLSRVDNIMKNRKS